MYDYSDDSKHSSSKLIWRIINGIGCLFFLFAALVNFNDHDWYLWVTIYICTSVFLAIELFNYRSLPIVIIYVNALVFCLMIAFGCHFLFKYQYESNVYSMKNHFLHYEEGRELSGLALAIGWLFLVLIHRVTNFNYRLSLVIISCGLIITLVPIGLWSVCFISDDWRQRFPQCHAMITSQHHSHFHPTL